MSPVSGQPGINLSSKRAQNFPQSTYPSVNPTQTFSGRTQVGHSIPIFESNIAPSGGNFKPRYTPPVRQSFKGQPRQQSIRSSIPATKPGQIQITPGSSRGSVNTTNPGNPRPPSGNVQYYLSSRAKTKIRKPDKFFACDDCGKMFTSHMGLYFHKPIHTGEWKYTCAICQRGFQETKKYNKHIESHRRKLQIQL